MPSRVSPASTTQTIGAHVGVRVGVEVGLGVGARVEMGVGVGIGVSNRGARAQAAIRRIEVLTITSFLISPSYGPSSTPLPRR